MPVVATTTAPPSRNYPSSLPPNQAQNLLVPFDPNDVPSKCTTAYTLRCVFGTIIFYALSAVPVWLCAQIPDIDTESELFEKLFYRGNIFYTTYIPIGTFFLYLTMNTIGFAFINIVNLQNTRPNPFWDEHGNLKSFQKMVFIWTPIIWLCSTMFTLRGKYDTESYCDEYMFTEVLDQEGKIVQDPESDNCHIYSKKEIFIYNYFVWTLFFFLGLQFTHADRGIMQKFVLDWNVMKTWPLILWVIFFALIAFLLCIALDLLTIYVQFHLQYLYIVQAIALASYFFYRSHGAKDTHIHHYVVALLVLSFLGYRSLFLTAVHGIFSGVFIEGSSRYGIDPIWTYESSEVGKKRNSVGNLTSSSLVLQTQNPTPNSVTVIPVSSHQSIDYPPKQIKRNSSVTTTNIDSSSSSDSSSDSEDIL